MSKKRRRRPEPTVQLSTEEYAALLARAGSVTLDMLNSYEDAVVADPATWAEPFGATAEQMVAGIRLLRAAVLTDVLNASVTAAGV